MAIELAGDGAERGAPLDRLHALVEGGYPRPQLVRPRWQDLNGTWEFCFDDDDVGRARGYARPGAVAFDQSIEVPYPPESKRSGIGSRGGHPICWYRRRVTLPSRGEGDVVVVHFGAIDYAAEIYLDGSLAAVHLGGHTPIRCVLEEDHGGELVIVVRAEDRAQAADQPRGKQDWLESPHGVWYWPTSGIWQQVWLEVLPRDHLRELALDVDTARALVKLEAGLSGGGAAALRIRLCDGASILAEQTQRVAGGPQLVAVVHVPAFANDWDLERFEWSPEQPHLVGVEIELLDAEGATIDAVLSYVGVRKVGTGGGRFLLNGAPYYLRMVLTQGYWDDTHLAAPDAGSLREEVELIKSFGFNGARMHQKIEDPRFLYWADRLGLLVWEELPSAAGFSNTATERLVAEWMEVLHRDISHPSVVAWVPFNESWGVPEMLVRPEQRALVGALASLTRALDPHRPVISNDGWEHVDSDIVTVHDYAPRGDELRTKYGSAASVRALLEHRWPAVRPLVLGPAPALDRPVVLSEFGGVALASERDGAWHGYSVAEDADALLERLSELFGALEDCTELAGYCYTQLADTEQESNGLAWADRKPKIAPEEVRRVVLGGGDRAS